MPRVEHSDCHIGAEANPAVCREVFEQETEAREWTVDRGEENRNPSVEKKKIIAIKGGDKPIEVVDLSLRSIIFYVRFGHRLIIKMQASISYHKLTCSYSRFIHVLFSL